MKTYYLFLFVVFGLLSSSCKDKVTDTYKVQTPVYMSYEDLRTSVKTTPKEDIVKPGKIYFKDDLIFINEYRKGIHIVNNTDPANPVVLKFIEIPGNVDLAVKGNVLYADSYVDLVALDVSDLDNIKETARIQEAFPYQLPHFEDGVIEYIDPQEGVVIDWIEETRTEEVEATNYDWRMYAETAFMDVNTSSGAAGKGNSGVGGSMARFTLYDNFLYAVDEYSLNLFDVSTPETPVSSSIKHIGWGIETIFPYEGKLFIGGQTGMQIFSLENPQDPSFISEFRHAKSCDPVVVQGDLAYVTLRAGNLCGDVQSQLDVIDISDLSNPTLLKEYEMQEPYGLGIDQEALFVCDGSAGLKVFNASDPLKIDENIIKTYPDVNAFDVIPLGDVLLMIGKDGFYQYDYSDLENITQLSHIPIYD